AARRACQPGKASHRPAAARGPGVGGGRDAERASVTMSEQQFDPTRRSTGERAAGPGEGTRLLRDAAAGNGSAVERVLTLIYEDLRVSARKQLRREHQSRTLEPTALVHEAYLKIVRGTRVDATDRAHLLALAARAMRQVLVDHARRRAAAKREGAWKQVTLTDPGPPGSLSA